MPSQTGNQAAPSELSQAQFMDLLARSQGSSLGSNSQAPDLAALLGSGSSNATSSGFAIGKSKTTRTYHEFPSPAADLVMQPEPESPLMPGDFAAKPKAKGRNRTRLYCPRDGCGSLILLEGAAEWEEVDGELSHLPQEQGSPFTSNPTSSSSTSSFNPIPSASRLTWHVQGVPMCFENIGFTRTASGASSISAPQAGLTSQSQSGGGGRAVKYMICAECDLGPLGWCYEGGTEGWLGLGRVRYGQ